jgi:hypothetical protein
MKSLLTLFLISLLLGSCKKEEFNTQINISLNSGIRTLKTSPTPILITSTLVDMNKEYKKVIQTIYTDSFGRYSNTINIKKPGNREFYKIEPEETLWILPLYEPQNLTAGFENNIVFDIAPKWRKFIYLTDSSGIFKPEQIHSLHNRSRNYAGILYNIDSFPKNSRQEYLITAPSDSYISVILSLRNIDTKKLEIRNYKYNANNHNTIWINF